MAHITEKRTAVILQALQDKHSAEWCGKYGEPGYTDPEKGVILCNWNNVNNISQDYLEQAGFELEWQDEWVIDYNNDKAYRTEPDCYSWVRQYLITDGGDCLFPDDGAGEFIGECELTDYNQPIRALPAWITDDDLTEAGYTKANDESYEVGFHPGQNADPAKIAKALFESGAESVVFQIDHAQQFDVSFSAWIKKDNDE